MLINMIPKPSLLFIPIALFLILSADNLPAHSWMAPKEAAQKQNPISLNRISTDTGKKVYMENCAYCHGDNAKGQSSKITGLQKDTPDLILRLKNHTDGDFHWKIQNGKNEMPSFKEDLSEKDIWHVINFIKSIEDL